MSVDVHRESTLARLMQLGYSREQCEQAVNIHGNNIEATTEYLLANPSIGATIANIPDSDPPAPAPPADWQRVDTGISSTVSASTLSAARAPYNPLDVLSGADTIKILDSGDGWVVMDGHARPMVFACEESTWYGKLFAGKMRQVEFLLLDLDRRPIVSMKKPYSWGSQCSTISISPPAPPPGDEAAPEEALGIVQQEWDAFQRKLFVTDATPNHAAGTLLIQAGMTDRAFKITLNGEVLGTITQPKMGMGVANLELVPGALDPFRSNRMRALLICASLMVCDMYWSQSPGSATILKVIPH
eukprot:CAMPEP_0181296320 /NCGR_PEP_ID=MMETSP1101-20121128/4640_1 /TAXON_ID=46948 /ORGANISM="Rhodomonas abbreviata, Strain Caron Lab Isolate" /LENGTH=300 /DNA_ID=CAMNT_0023401175 /DNA_START=14 /DNA_END=916 /DNA_ORIENTATION=+